MEKKFKIVIIIAIVMIALVVGLFFISGDEMAQSKDLLMTIGDEEYDVDNFRKYMTIKKEEDGDVTKILEAEEMDSMVQGYLETKIYAKAATNKGITFSGDDIENAKTTYEEKKETLSKYNVTEEDYLKYAEDKYKQETLTSNFSDYYELSDEMYNQVVEGISGDQKTYGFRIMAFNYEEETSGDEELSGDEEAVAPETESGEEAPDYSRPTILANAENALARVKGGEDFEEVSKELGTYRFTFKGTGYTIVNGELEYAVAPVLESKVNNTELYNALLALNPGEYTELVEDTENRYIYFAKLESVEDGFVGDALDELKQIILSELQDTLVTEGITFDVNQGGLLKAFYKQQ